MPKAAALVNRLDYYVRQLSAAAERDAVALGKTKPLDLPATLDEVLAG